jgi:casein kinase II subunit beta
MMASRQRPAANVEDAQRVLEDEEAVSGPGEGDEIMEEAEEQEDGYSEPFLLIFNTLFCVLNSFSVAARDGD